jgi:outer membrane murein-binding lipoprotein Lpp
MHEDADPRPPDNVTHKAVRSIVAQGEEVSLVDVVKVRILRQFSAALEGYLVMRIGHVGCARDAMQALRDAVAEASDKDLASSPSVHAHLLKMAREIALKARTKFELDVDGLRPKLPWDVEPTGENAQLFTRIRTALPDKVLELLELKYLHRLSPEEMAAVLDAPLADVTRDTDKALESLQAEIPAAGGVSSAFLGILDDALLLNLDEPDGPASESSGLFTGIVLDGRYRLDKRVGEGAFGEVYRATDTHVPGHVVALKLLHQPATSEEMRASALRELQLIASVFHPSIVQFKDHGWFEGRLWFVMPWYEGENLESRMRRAPLTRVAAHRIFTSLARALAAMHAAGIRHQDVKPENVLLARIKTSADDGELPVLLDLGVAAKEAEILIAGTPTYFAPEVAARFAGITDAPKIGPKADVFSLALALRNALDPSLDESIGESVDVFIARRAMRAPPPPKSRDLAFLAPKFARWMDVDPAKRPDANQLADELDVLLEPETKRARRRAVLALVLPLLAVAIGAVGAFGYIGLKEVVAQRRAAANAAAHAQTLEAELGTTRAERSMVDTRLSRAESQLEQGRLSQSELEETVEVVRASLDAMRDRAQDAERARAAETNRRIAAEAERDRALARAWNAAQSLIQRGEELDRTRAQAQTLRARVDSLTRDVNRARADAQAARVLATGADARARAAQERLDAARLRIQQLERRQQ